MNFILGFVIVIGGWWLIKAFANAQPSQVRNLIKKLAGGGVIAFAGLLALRGQINIAMPLFVLGAGLMGQQALFRNGMPWQQKKSAGQSSKVATGVLAMELDHDTGRMDGSVLTGPYRGRRLSSLTLPEAKSLHSLCASTADQSRALFEAWIERTHPEWRAQWGSGAGQTAASAPSGKMSRGEALAILGLRDGSSHEDIRAAHRRLMKAAHPDMGGSDYLAAKINEAKEQLLRD